ncbi:MAG: hypothetical protein PHQ01_01670 [Candidatus Pacebacteria bacterium]|nr:hypothetical protein [Candidatus Paceibacterota bacterium]
MFLKKLKIKYEAVNSFLKKHVLVVFIMGGLLSISPMFFPDTNIILKFLKNCTASIIDTIINTMDEKTEELKGVNNEICNAPIENKWIINGKNIQINLNHLLFEYNQGCNGSEITYGKKIEFNDSKDLILQFSSQDIIENDTISILLKDEIGNIFLKIETSKLDIKLFTKNNGEWIENQKITYGKKIENYPIFYFKLSISKDGNHFRMSTIPKHKDYLDSENEFMNEEPINADIILKNMNYMNNIQLGIGIFTSLKHNIDVEIHECEILK